jgi:hypothetical protein
MTEEEEEAACAEIIGILQRARKKPFTDDEVRKVWDSVLEVDRFHKRDPQTLSATERRQAEDIAAGLGKARKLIEKALKLPNLANALIGTWDMAEHYDAPVVKLRRKADFQMMIDGVAALEDVTRQVSVPRGRGRPKDTALMPKPTLDKLSRVYVRATGSMVPKAGVDRFVSAFTKWFVQREFQKETIVKARKKLVKSQTPMPWRALPPRR